MSGPALSQHYALLNNVLHHYHIHDALRGLHHNNSVVKGLQNNFFKVQSRC